MIVAQAGRKGAVTVATNMAGRGVDILLGGNPEYLARQEMAAREFDNDRYLLFEMDDEERAAYEAEYEPVFAKLKDQTDAEHEEVVGLGGLYVLGTERHESRRIDNQLRGRSGRQGDPGASLFYLSLEDDLMRMFASDRVASIMERLKWPEGEPIEAKMVSQGRRERAEADRGAQLRAPQERPEVRRGDERPARGDLRRAPQDPRGPEPEGAGARLRRGRRRRRRRTSGRPPTSTPSDWDREGLLTALRRVLPGREHGRGPRRVRRAPSSSATDLVAEALAAYEAKEARCRRRGDARARARRAAQHHRHEVARAPLRDGLPAGGHPPAGLRAARSARRVPARGVRRCSRSSPPRSRRTS